ncbi:MAG: glutathione synthase, partial [Alphaproteobacteria bacterium]|nr:glutathione synthase [Alphaproteobacteria bacterium]
EIAAFLREHRAIVLKPLYMFGGEGVEKLSSDSPRAAAQIADYLATQPEPVVAQRFLPEVVEGDTRILLVDGTPVGALRRVPQQDSIRSNLHSGGDARKGVLSPRMRDICAAIGPELKKRGLLFVGIDIIGDYLTEINVTSPTCLQEINAHDGVQLERGVWDAIETKKESSG